MANQRYNPSLEKVSVNAYVLFSMYVRAVPGKDVVHLVQNQTAFVLLRLLLIEVFLKAIFPGK